MSFKIGITGSFGAGKTTVAAMFRARGAAVIDADVLAHALIDTPGCRRAVRQVFGSGVIGPKGVDRRALGKLVFDDVNALKALEAILHPRLGRMVRREITERCSRYPVVVLDAAILIEAGWHKLVDAVLVVNARRDVQLKRVMARTGLSRADVLKRIRRQMPLSSKKRYAAYIVDNSGTPATTQQRVERILRSLSTHPSNRRES